MELERLQEYTPMGFIASFSFYQRIVFKIFCENAPIQVELYIFSSTSITAIYSSMP
jgi:hypothetical protein